MAPLRTAVVIARNDMRRRLRDRTAILMGVVTPLVMAALIGLAFGGSGFSARIAVVDADGSEMSQSIASGLVSQTPADAPLRFERVADVDTARARLSAGQVDAVIVVPKGFGSAIPAMATGVTPPPLDVIVDANKRIAGDVTRSIADGISARISASVLAVATALAVGPQPPDAARVQQIVAAGRDVSVPIALDQVDVAGRYNPVAYFGASMGILFLFFTVGAGARSLIIERKEGTLARVRAAPLDDNSVLLGKSIGVLLLGLASLLTIWVVTTVGFRAPWGDPVAVVLVIASVVFAVAGISTMVTGLARTDAQADGLTSILAFGFALLGGSFQQPGSLPGVFARLALLTPNGWALKAFTQIGAAGATTVDVLPSIAVLLVMGTVTTLVGLRALRGKLAQ